MFEKRFWKILYLLTAGLFLVTLQQLHSIASTSEAPATTVPYILNNASTIYSPPLHHLGSHDYHQLIDIYFEFNILNLVCNTTESPLLLIVIHSASSNWKKRRTIRETWGSNNTKEVRILFMIGSSTYLSVQKKILLESRMHGDIIQGSFIDTYRNITYKHVMSLKYVSYHCAQTKYVLKLDDDVFVNMPAVFNFLLTNLSPFGARNLICCELAKRTRVLRSYRSKWRVSFKEYPDKYYPPYCMGWAIFYSPDVIFALYAEAQNSNYFWIDDTHITGTLTKKLKLVHTLKANLTLYSEHFREMFSNPIRHENTFMFFGPDLTENDFFILKRYFSE